MSAGPQTTKLVTPPSTIDQDALDATWPLSGNWLIYLPDGADAGNASHGFMVFGVQLNGDRLVSAGHGQCFLYSGRAVNTDNRTQIVPIEDAAEPTVECDPGPAPSAYTQAVACLNAGCQLDLKDNVLRLTDDNGEQMAELVRTTTDVP